MGDRKDIRILIKETDYQDLEEYVIGEMGDEKLCYLMKNIDIKTERIVGDGTKYIYFGWDNVEWYNIIQFPKYKEVCLIDDSIKELYNYHFLERGEDWTLVSCSVLNEHIEPCDINKNYISIAELFENLTSQEEKR